MTAALLTGDLPAVIFGTAWLAAYLIALPFIARHEQRRHKP